MATIFFLWHAEHVYAVNLELEDASAVCAWSYTCSAHWHSHLFFQISHGSHRHSQFHFLAAHWQSCLAVSRVHLHSACQFSIGPPYASDASFISLSSPESSDSDDSSFICC